MTLNPLLKQGHPETVVQDLNISTDGDNLPVQPVPGLSQPDSDKVFLDVQTEAPVFPFLPISSGPTTGQN